MNSTEIESQINVIHTQTRSVFIIPLLCLLDGSRPDPFISQQLQILSNIEKKDKITHFEILADSSQLKKHDDIKIGIGFSNLRTLPRPPSATSLFAVLQVLVSLALDILEYQRVTESAAERSAE